MTSPQPSQQSPLLVFASALVEKADLGKLEPNYKAQYIERIALQAQEAIGLMAFEELSEDALEQFAKLNNSKISVDEVFSFFQKNVPDFEKKMEKTLTQFAEDFMRRSTIVKKEI